MRNIFLSVIILIFAVCNVVNAESLEYSTTLSNLKTLKAKANHGDIDAQNTLGEIYLKGFSFYDPDHPLPSTPPISMPQSVRQFYSGPDGLKQYAEMAKMGKTQQVHPDEEEAFRWFLKSADRGDRIGEKFLGWYYQHGSVVQKNYSKAAYWYEKAATQNDADAEDLLGRLYKNGFGIPQNYAVAGEWFVKSAVQLDYDAAQDLSYLYATGGYGIHQSYGDAYFWNHLQKNECWPQIIRPGNLLTYSSLGNYLYIALPGHLSPAQINYESLKIQDWKPPFGVKCFPNLQQNNRH